MTSRALLTYLWIIDLSYSSPSGVFMMAYSSRVTWCRAGFSIVAEMVLISWGSTLPGESRERDPTAFMDDYQGKTTMVSIHWNGLKNICPAGLTQMILSSGLPFLETGLLGWGFWHLTPRLGTQSLLSQNLLSTGGVYPSLHIFPLTQATAETTRSLSFPRLCPKISSGIVQEKQRPITWFMGVWVVILGRISSRCLVMKSLGSIFILIRRAGQSPDCTTTKQRIMGRTHRYKCKADC